MNPYIPSPHRQAYTCFRQLRAMGVSVSVARAIARQYITRPALPVRPSAFIGSYNRITCGLN